MKTSITTVLWLTSWIWISQCSTDFFKNLTVWHVISWSSDKISCLIHHLEDTISNVFLTNKISDAHVYNESFKYSRLLNIRGTLIYFPLWYYWWGTNYMLEGNPDIKVDPLHQDMEKKYPNLRTTACTCLPISQNGRHQLSWCWVYRFFSSFFYLMCDYLMWACLDCFSSESVYVVHTGKELPWISISEEHFVWFCCLCGQLWMKQCKAGFHSVTAKSSVLKVCW